MFALLAITLLPTPEGFKAIHRRSVVIGHHESQRRRPQSALAPRPVPSPPRSTTCSNVDCGRATNLLETEGSGGGEI